MRPVRRGKSPQTLEFDPYKEALPHLISRLGPYCSYCERHLVTLIAVEHIQPKGLSAYAHLIGTWNNYLLACVNCNAAKKDKDVVLSEFLLPDRDNTFYAFTYSPDGKVKPAARLDPSLRHKAASTLSLTGLDKDRSVVLDENGKEVALDRVGQRMESWAQAMVAQMLIARDPSNEAVKLMAVELAKATGFFSIWMTVFAADTDMCNRFIDAFEGTRASGAFDPLTTQAVSPAPNPDALTAGGKV